MTVAAIAFPAVLAAVTPNMFPGAADDSAAIQAAVDLAASRGEPAVVPAWNERRGTNVWTISRTVLLPSDSTLYLDNCRVVMADGVFCNAFANSKAWSEDRNSPAAVEREIRIVGVGRAIVDGGEYNGWGERSVPGGKMADTAKENAARLPKRLVHNCPLYFHNVRGFEVRGVCVRRQRYWGMCFSFCSHGEIRDIRFEADISYVSDDGLTHDPNRLPERYRNVWVKNGDGIDLRSGCHDILVENVTGWTEDDVIALTNLQHSEAADKVEGESTDLHHVTIRNVRAGCWKANIIRLLCGDGTKIHDVSIDGVMDTSFPGWTWRATSSVLVNDAYDEYIHHERVKMGDLRNVSIANVFSESGAAVRLTDAMENVSIRNVRASRGCQAAVLTQGRAVFKNVAIDGICCDSTAKIGAVLDLHEASGELDVRNVRADSAEHVLRRSGGDVKVNLSDIRVFRLGGSETADFSKGQPGYGAHWFSGTIK